MPHNPFDPDLESLPDIIPIFPLEGALLLPRGELPLNVFLLEAKCYKSRADLLIKLLEMSLQSLSNTPTTAQ